MNGLGIAALYCDGGVIDANPSRHGGTWCWVQVGPDGRQIRHQAGTITPDEAGMATISNNLTELLAAVMGMDVLPVGWDGTVYTDSQVTLYRLTRDRPRFLGVPAWLIDATWQARRRLGSYRVKLLGGHPTKADLQVGHRARDGMPCSPHNVFCDRMCADQARRFRLTPEYADGPQEQPAASVAGEGTAGQGPAR